MESSTEVGKASQAVWQMFNKQLALQLQIRSVRKRSEHAGTAQAGVQL